MPATTRAAKLAGGRGRGGAKKKVSKKPGDKVATPKQAKIPPKPRASKRKRANVSFENIPDIDTPPSPPQRTHPKLVIINSPPVDPILEGLLQEEAEVLKLLKQKEARDRLARLKAQMGEEGNSSQGVSETPGASPPSTTASTPSPGIHPQGNVQVYAHLQQQAATAPTRGGGQHSHDQCCHQSGEGPFITGETRARHFSAPSAPFRPQANTSLNTLRANPHLANIAEDQTHQVAQGAFGHHPSSTQNNSDRGKPSKSGFHVGTSNSHSQVNKPEYGQGGIGGGGKLYCRYFQSGKCRFSHAPHPATIGNKKVQVHHFCASCYRQSGKMVDHPASDSKCPSANRK